MATNEDELSLKREAFAIEYTVDFNGTRAAIRAGYAESSAHVTASRLLKDAKVLARIRERVAELTMSADEALLRLSQHARGDLGEFLALSVDDLKAHPQSHLLHKVKRTIRTIPVKDGEPETEERIELELYDAQAALVQILKEQHLRGGEATDRSEGSMKLDLSGLTTEQLQALAGSFKD
jgi:phage terminase small subunit